MGSYGWVFSPADFGSYLSKYCRHNSSRVDSSLAPGSLSKTGFAIQKEQNEKVGIGVNTKGAEEEEQDHLQFLFNQLFSSCSSIPATTFLGSGGGTEGLHSTGDPQLGHTWIAREGGIQHVI